MWPLVCKQDSYMIWPSDLSFDPTQPMIHLEWDIIKTNILSKFEEDWVKMLPQESRQEYSKIWPSDLFFLSDPTNDRTWPSYHPEKHSGHVWGRLDKKCAPKSVKKYFSKNGPSDLHSNPTQLMIHLDRDIIMTNILNKFEEDWAKNVAPRVYIRYV